jgi:hypothetical protein
MTDFWITEDYVCIIIIVFEDIYSKVLNMCKNIIYNNSIMNDIGASSRPIGRPLSPRCTVRLLCYIQRT